MSAIRNGSEIAEVLPHIPAGDRQDFSPAQLRALTAFCTVCKQCGGDVDSFPDCLGDGDYSPSGHMPCCDLCIRVYRLVVVAQAGEGGSPMTDVRNETDLEFTDISSEHWRRYTFVSGMMVVVEKPLWLNVSDNGGHRILDSFGYCHYIPYGWVHLEWQAKDGSPHFVK